MSKEPDWWGIPDRIAILLKDEGTTMPPRAKPRCRNCVDGKTRDGGFVLCRSADGMPYPRDFVCFRYKWYGVGVEKK